MDCGRILILYQPHELLSMLAALGPHRRNWLLGLGSSPHSASICHVASTEDTGCLVSILVFSDTAESDRVFLVPNTQQLNDMPPGIRQIDTPCFADAPEVEWFTDRLGPHFLESLGCA